MTDTEQQPMEQPTVRLETKAEQCPERYPVPGKREEPFDVTYRCGRPLGHDGPHSTRRVEGEAATAPNADPVPPRVERWAIRCNGYVGDTFFRREHADSSLGHSLGFDPNAEVLTLVELREGEDVFRVADVTASRAAREATHREILHLRGDLEAAERHVLILLGQVADLRSQLAAARQRAEDNEQQGFKLAEMLAAAQRELGEVTHALVPMRALLMDPPDGGNARLGEQVARLVAEYQSANTGWVGGVVEQGAIEWPPTMDGASGTIVTEHVVALRYTDWPIGTRVEVRRADTDPQAND